MSAFLLPGMTSEDSAAYRDAAQSLARGILGYDLSDKEVLALFGQNISILALDGYFKQYRFEAELRDQLANGHADV